MFSEPDSVLVKILCKEEPMMFVFSPVPPDIDDDASSGEVLVKEGENAALRCIATGTPLPSITWRREDSRHFKIDNQTLGEYLKLIFTLRSRNEQDGGTYTCGLIIRPTTLITRNF